MLVAESQPLTDSSAFDSLPEAEPVIGLAPSEQKPDRTPDEHYCETCDKPITREEGARGRWPKFHPECRPSVKGKTLGTSTRSTKTRDAKKAAEADEVIVMVKKRLLQGAMMISLVDPYDGFCVMSGINPMCENLRAILIAYDSLRRDALRINTGGSIFGLVIAVITMVLPILAHHGIIPSKKIASMLVNLPVMMHKMAQRMEEGEEALNGMMNRVADEMLKQPAREKAEHNGGASSPNP